MKDIVLKGSVFGMLTVLKESDRIRLPSGQVNRVFNCVCECGKVKDIRYAHLKRLKISSCGCKKQISTKGVSLSTTDLGIVWNSIRTRTKENYFQSHLYFNKGVAVCQEWKNSIDSFCDWGKSNGYKKGLQLDRIDNSKGYSPDNCRFVTSKVNNNNRDNTFFVFYNNEKIALKLLLEKLKKEKDYHSILARIKRGWSEIEAINKPMKIGNYKIKEIK